MFKKNILAKNFWWLFLFLMSFVILFLSIFKPVQNIDSATFIYIGKLMLSGGIPYRDVFDHKAPLIYFIDAFGLMIAQKQIWGVWVLEFVNLFISVSFSYLAIRRILDSRIALISVMAWLAFIPVVFDGGNLTEEYALLFQFFAIYLYISRDGHLNGFYIFILGLIFGILFNIKPNLTGVPISIFFVQLVYSNKINKSVSLLKNGLSFLFGFLVVLIPILAYFYLNNSFYEYINYSYRFNSYYLGVPFSNTANVIYRGVQIMIFSPLGFIGLLSYFDVLVIRAYALKHKQINKVNILVKLILILLPIEFGLVSTSGKIYNHYYIAWLPLFSLLFAYGVYRVSFVKLFKVFRFRTEIVAAGVLIFLCLQLYRQYKIFEKLDFRDHPIISYIKRNSYQEDDMLFWGFGSPIYLALEKKSPTKYVYQTPLYIRGFQQKKMYDEFLEEIKFKKPLLIVDGVEDGEKFPQITCEQNFFPKQKRDFYPMNDLKKIYDYICTHYKKSEPVQGWRVYTRI